LRSAKLTFIIIIVVSALCHNIKNCPRCWKRIVVKRSTMLHFFDQELCTF